MRQLDTTDFLADLLAALMAGLADPDVRRSLAVTDLGEDL